MFQAAIDAGATVRPVRITYRTAAHSAPEHPTGPAAGAVAFVGADPLAASLWRVVRAAGLTAHIDVLAPIPANGEDGRRALARRARTAVLGPEEPRRSGLAGRTGKSGQTTVASDRANRPAESVHH